MTDKQIDAIEEAARFATPGEWKDHLGIIYSTTENEICVCRGINGFANADFIIRTNPVAVLELIAELRQTRKERDWLAEKLESNTFCCLPDNKECECSFCSECEYGTYEGWLNAAKEATSCQK